MYIKFTKIIKKKKIHIKAKNHSKIDEEMPEFDNNGVF
jgi:hypothetical protein